MIKSTFFTADWHIGHKAVIDFDNRPFRDLDHMHRVLTNNYNSTVPVDGVCYFVGDAGLCSSSTLKHVIRFLNGTKVLVLGNHDKGTNAMYGVGFDVVVHGLTLYIAGERVTVSHCPLLEVGRENTEGMNGSVSGEHWHGESRHRRFSTTDQGQFHIHGHIHSPNRGKSKRICGRQIDVGVSANRFTPVAMKEIEKWITATKRGEQAG